MTNFSSSLFDKTICLSYDEIFNNEDNKSVLSEQLDFIDPFRINGITDFNSDILDSKILDDYNKKINGTNINYDIDNNGLHDNNPDEKISNKDKTIISDKINVKVEKKTKVKLGRKRLGEVNDSDIVHSKESPDNMRIKFKRLFFNNLVEFLNDGLYKSKNLKLKSLEFKKLNSDYIKRLKRDLNLKMLNSPATDALSQDIAKK